MREHGIGQFLDIGSGLPTVGNVHKWVCQLNGSVSLSALSLFRW